MNNNFLRLHITHDNSVVIINKSLIGLIDTCYDNGKNYSEIYLLESLADGVNTIQVNETPEKIFKMLEN